ncbi:MAG: caspase family protein [Bacteroidota bacterium]
MKHRLILILFLLLAQLAIAQRFPDLPSNSSQPMLIQTKKKQKKQTKAKTSIIWMASEQVQTQPDQVQVLAIIKSKEKISANNIRLLVNGKASGAKADVVKLKAVASQMQQLEYENTIVLEEGLNKLEIAIEQEDGTLKKSYAKVLKKEDTNIQEIQQHQAENDKGIYWQVPQWSSHPIVINHPQFKVKVLIQSSIEVQLSDIYFLREGIHKIQPASDAQLIKKGTGQYELTTSLTLPAEGIQELQVKSNAKLTGELQSEPLMLNFTPYRPNLHLLSIGTETNLAYTQKDAQDFANCFERQAQNQGGRLFQQVNSDVLIGKEASAISIKSKIEQLEARYKTGAISERDLIVFYISSHGFLDEKRQLRIQADDYTPAAPRATSISYERDIVEVLEAIPCKKLVFIDACYSGDTKSNNIDIDYQLEQLNQPLKGFTTIVSSGGNEASYEDAQWENGAFTEAILEGLFQRRANQDGNAYITISELWSYLEMRVPELVETVKQRAQHPSLKKNDLGDLAIYYVN